MSICYPTCFWRPFANLIEGKYDDNGHITLVDTPLNRLRLLYFFKNLAYTAAISLEGSNPVHDKYFEFNATAKTCLNFRSLIDSQRVLDDVAFVSTHFFQELELMWECLDNPLRESRLFARNTMGNLRPLQFAVMHKSAYDILCGISQKALTDFEGEVATRSLFEGALREIDTLLSFTPSVTVGGIEEYMRARNFCEYIRRVGNYSSEQIAGESDELLDFLRAYQKGSLSEEQLYQHIKPSLEGHLAFAGLDQVGVAISPLRYASADDNYGNEQGIVYAQFVEDTSRAVTAIRQKWFEGI